MTLPRDFEKTLTVKTDEELYDMMAHSADYLPEALAAIRVESQHRNLSPTRVAQLDKQSQRIRAQEEQTAQQPLSFLVSLVMFLLPFGLIQFVVAEAYRNRGYARKYKECWIWMWYGLGFWISFWIAFCVIGLAFNLNSVPNFVISASLGIFAATRIARYRRGIGRRRAT